MALQFANDIGNPTLVANLRVQISAKHEQRENPLYLETAEPPMERVRAFVVPPDIGRRAAGPSPRAANRDWYADS